MVKELKLKNGKNIKSLEELRSELKKMSNEIFKFHVNNKRNDFYNWVKKELKNHKLAADLIECTTKEAMQFCLKSKTKKKTVKKKVNSKINKEKIKLLIRWSPSAIIKKLKEVYKVD
jgi:hypothetical protein